MSEQRKHNQVLREFVVSFLYIIKKKGGAVVRKKNKKSTE